MTEEEAREALKRMDELEAQATKIRKTLIAPLDDEISKLRVEVYNQSIKNAETLERDEIWNVFLLPNEDEPTYMDMFGDIENTSLGDIRLTLNKFSTLESKLSAEDWKELRKLAEYYEDMYCKFHWGKDGKVTFIGYADNDRKTQKESPLVFETVR